MVREGVSGCGCVCGGGYYQPATGGSPLIRSVTDAMLAVLFLSTSLVTAVTIRYCTMAFSHSLVC